MSTEPTRLLVAFVAAFLALACLGMFLWAHHVDAMADRTVKLCQEHVYTDC